MAREIMDVLRKFVDMVISVYVDTWDEGVSTCIDYFSPWCDTQKLLKKFLTKAT